MPRILGPIPANKAERVVYRALEKQLPSDWVVLSNVSWSSRQVGHGGRTWVRDGQADFVVIAPGFGLCTIEVKGSRFIRVGDNGLWYRSWDGESWDRIEPKTPPEQATTNTHEITRLVSQRKGWKRFPWAFGYLVIYPNGEVLEGGFTTFDPSTVLLKNSLRALTKRIRNTLGTRGAEARHHPLSGDAAAEIGELLMNHPLEIGPVDSAEDVARDTDTINRLTQQQHAALQGIFRHPSVAVTGPAGSGKTVLAIWRLRALLEQGARALFLCFNKMLAEQLRLLNPDLVQAIQHVDSYFTRLAGRSPPRSTTDINHYFFEVLPGLVFDLDGEAQDQLVDALVIDEGQDFGEYRLCAARSLVREGGYFLYCSDDRQDLYDRRVREAVGAEVVFSLVHNCRNTVRINQAANRVLDEHVRPMPGLPEGVDPHIEHISDPRQMAKAAWRFAAGWIGQNSRVAILSPFTLENSSMARSQRGHNLELTTKLVEWTEERVLFSTIKSFKGLEADAVVVVDMVGPGHAAFDRRDLYVAATRGRSRLAVLCSDSTVARPIRSGP